MHQLEDQDTRSGFGEGLVEVMKNKPEVVCLCADLTHSLKMNTCQTLFPERFFQMGIAEANMMSVAAGMTIGNKIPYVGTFASFSAGRAYDQIRQSIAYSNKNVKICASHAGLTAAQDGATHQILEDIGLMKMLPNLVVISPCDYNQTKAATIAIAKYNGPVYIRFGKQKTKVFTQVNQKFEIGKAYRLTLGQDITLFTHGDMVYKTLEAYSILKKQRIYIEIINVATIKPLDKTSIINSVKKTKCGLVIEEHQRNGGLSDSIAQILSKHYPVLLDYVTINDHFGESGSTAELLKKYQLTTDQIVKKVFTLLHRKVN